jgi:peptide/nickel transport system substrate-binding protein
VDVPAGGHCASYRKEVRAVEHGRDDVAFDGVPRRLLHEVRTQYANQAHAHPLWGVTYLYLNARRPPFNDVRVRRAVNYAADRAAAVPAAAQALGAEPTCQILPPNFPGFHRYCPYTMHPRGTGFWNQPDRKQARRLVAASGTKGAALTVWIPGNQNSEGPIAAALLRSIGYLPTHRARRPVRLVLLSPRYGKPAEQGAGRRQFVVRRLSGRLELHGLLRLQRLRPRLSTSDWGRYPASAERAAGRSRSRNQYGARVDHAMVDRAVAVPLITHKTLDLVSQRVGNYESIPYSYGVLLDQLWVK